MNCYNRYALKNRRGRLKTGQQGMTLVEVLVSMFVLAVGVLALLATQLRTVASVQEAESQTIVAQAVQNLTESMMINPTLCSKEDQGDSRCSGKVNAQTPDNWVVKSYDNDKMFVDGNAGAISYRFSNPTKVRNCSQSNYCKPPTSASLNKRELLEDHLGRFEESLSNSLPNANTWYIICNDDSGNDMWMPDPPDPGDKPRHECSGGANHPLVIKVLWEIEVEIEEEKLKELKDSRTLKSNGKKIVYTYQARLAE